MKRQVMVEQLRRMGIRDPKILEAIGRVPRDAFLPEGFKHPDAYGNHPLPIGHDQTISQPYIVAYMSEKMAIQEGEKILEIGTGSGYQAAVLGQSHARRRTKGLARLLTLRCNHRDLRPRKGTKSTHRTTQRGRTHDPASWHSTSAPCYLAKSKWQY